MINARRGEVILSIGLVVADAYYFTEDGHFIHNQELPKEVPILFSLFSDNLNAGRLSLATLTLINEEFIDGYVMRSKRLYIQKLKEHPLITFEVRTIKTYYEMKKQPSIIASMKDIT